MVVLLPLTKKSTIFRWPVSISIIDTHNGTGEGGDLTKADEEGFVDLPKRGDINSAEEHYEPSERKHECGE